MEIDVRPYDGDPRPFFEAGELAFGERARDEDVERWTATFEADRAIAAYDAERVVGTAGIFSFELTVPGGVLPAAGVTIVGVHPTHRRRGILRRMMRLQLDAIHQRGEPLAILWASEGNIYQRFGYGLATMWMSIDVARDRSAFRLPHASAGSIRFVEVEEGRRLFPPVYNAVAPSRPGFFARSAAFWDAEFFPDPEHWRRGSSAAFHVVHESPEGPDGYLRYRIKEDWDNSGPKSTLQIVELMAANPAANLDLWRYAFDVDLIGKIDAWNLAVDDPIVLTVAEPRRLGIRLGDGLWLRVVDVSAALAGRRYRGDGRLTFELSDEFCPWNAGTWTLSVDGSEPEVTPATEPAQLALDATDLGAAYLGSFSFAQLAAAGRVRELDPGAVATADALFHTDRAPWCPRVF